MLNNANHKGGSDQTCYTWVRSNLLLTPSAAPAAWGYSRTGFTPAQTGALPMTSWESSGQPSKHPRSRSEVIPVLSRRTVAGFRSRRGGSCCSVSALPIDGAAKAGSPNPVPGRSGHEMAKHHRAGAGDGGNSTVRPSPPDQGPYRCRQCQLHQMPCRAPQQRRPDNMSQSLSATLQLPGSSAGILPVW